MSLDDRLIINAAITGCVLSKKECPNLPVTADEIVADARRVHEAGAAILHLHARDAEGANTHDAGIYRELIGRVRQAAPGMIICVSLSGRFEADLERRAAPLAAGADMASLTLGSMNFPLQANINEPQTVIELARCITAAGAVPELEAFEPGFVNYANYLIRKNVLRPPHYFNLLFGVLGAAPLDPLGLGYMVSLLPPGATWAAAGIGQYQLDANVMAIAAGGHVRVGLEDNIHFDRSRNDAADNPRLVERIVRIGREMGREPATPAEARRIIGLPEPRSGS